MSDIPDPEITATLITDDGQLSTSARRFQGKIDHDRWSIEATYSRGPVITASGQWTGRIADCVVIQATDEAGYVVLAYFLDGKYTGGFTWIWCADCVDPGFEHAISPPLERKYRDLCELVSAV